ncbi:hypothetical protein L210DRAFT_3520368 [Boletus edulis BED1]|uniref:Uncharacterized protein n=1 Tax=Boletus edulis BED1 TaxID=1328754 RepID=A0AAD4C6C8_BOLED|nr:hypothetical protein L210DRAFT_3520368 [Boletus edulis BED1]
MPTLPPTPLTGCGQSLPSCSSHGSSSWVGRTSMWNNAVNAWWPLLFYPATDAPRFTTGMITMICTCGATLVITWLVWYLERRERERNKETTGKT